MSTEPTSSPFTDLDRPPLREAALNRALVGAGGVWQRIEVLPELGSTNTELAGRAQQGAASGTVLVTEHQTAGRGRLGRGFVTPARAALTFSVLLRPEVSTNRFGWLPLLMGVAAVRGLGRVAGIDAALKWPNDVLTSPGDTAPPDGDAADPAPGAPTERKLAGILSEAAVCGDTVAAVIGMGLNVSQRRDELPADTATSLALEGAPCLDRDPLLRAVLRAFADLYREWERCGGDAEASGLAAAYRGHCGTIGRPVRVHLPGDRTEEGEATGVDADGRLLLRTAAGAEHALSAGDVVHVRPS